MLMIIIIIIIFNVNDNNNNTDNVNDDDDIQAVCPPMWDGASCLPASLESSLAVFPCMTYYNQQFYNTNGM